MATPFARSMRSLQTDRAQITLVILVLAMIIVVAWIVWFFGAQITIYETSMNAQMTSSNTMVAYFPPGSQGRIKQQQYALVTLDGVVGGKIGTFPALVTRVENQPTQDRIAAHLFIMPEHSNPQFLHTGLTGWVEVESSYMSPALLVMRTLGHFADTPEIQTSPLK